MKKFKLFNFRPIVIIAVFLALGIFFAFTIVMQKTLLTVLTSVLTVAVIALSFIFLGKKEHLKRNIIMLIIALLFFAIGGVNFYVQTDNYVKESKGNYVLEYTGKVVESYPTQYGTEYVLSNVTVSGKENGKLKYKLVVSIYEADTFAVGDVLSFTANVNDKGLIYNERFNSQDLVSGIKYYVNLNVEDVTVIGEDVNLFERVNLFIKNSLKNGMGENEYPVAYALLCGNSDFIDEEIISGYRELGVAHIFAVSGLHIGFLGGAISFILRKFKANKYVIAVVTVLALFFYSGVCGFTPSSLRAAVMFSVVLAVDCLGERYDGLSSISLAAIILLSVNPANLFSIGFELSFSAVIGIITLSNPLKKAFKFLPKKICETVAVSLSAQISVLPLSLLYFSQVSFISVIVNIIFIPFVSVLFVALLLLTVIGGIFSISKITLFVPNYVFYGLNYCMTLIDYSVFTIGGFSLGIFSLFYYGAEIFGSDIANIKLKPKLILIGVLLLICCAGTLVYNLGLQNQKCLYVVGSSNVCATVISDSENTVVVVNDYDGYSSVYKVTNAVKSANKSKINALIVPLNVSGNDVQVLMANFIRVIDVENLYFVGNDETVKRVIEKSYVNTSVNMIDKDGNGEYNGIGFTFDAKGYAVKLRYRNENMLLFSHLGEQSTNYKNAETEEYSYAICYDYSNLIYANYNPQKLITYKNSEFFENGETNGRLKILL